jgi:Cu+-exporting ATPase
MKKDLAVVMDVAGTILRMYRVAKDIERGIILERVVTWQLIMEKQGRALVVPQIDPDELLTSRADDTFGTFLSDREDRLEVSCSSSPVSKETARKIVFSSRVLIRDLLDVHLRIKARCPDHYHTAGAIVDADLQEIVYAVGTGGTPFPGIKNVLMDLNNLSADVYVASGDSMRSLAHLADLGIDLSRVYPVSSPAKKREIIENLKDRYRHVVMVGDGLNDLYALEAADLGILTVQQDTHPSPKLLGAADMIINNILELPKILPRNC